MENENDKYVIAAENLVKIYKSKDIEVLALQGLDVLIERGEVMAIIGNSGSGKSTFLNIVGCLDRPTAGKLVVDGKDLFKMTERDIVNYKIATVGFVWQNNARNLIPSLTALENVMMPMQFNEIKPIKNKRKRALELLELTGLRNRAHHRLNQLSGGEQQRVAIALAIANSPAILLADEPTGSVDTRTTIAIMEIFRKVNKEIGTTVVIVTHDREITNHVERVVSIRDGKISSEFIMSYKEKLENIDDFGKATVEEFAVLDRAGRVQIPRELLQKIGIEGNRVRISLDDNNGIVLNAP